MNIDEELDLTGLEDFELQKATYQVWVLNYNDKDEFVQSDIIYLSFEPEEAIQYAKNFATKMETWSDPVNKSTHYYEILVETVVDFGDYEENVGTLYSKIIKFK